MNTSNLNTQIDRRFATNAPPFFPDSGPAGAAHPRLCAHFSGPAGDGLPHRPSLRWNRISLAAHGNVWRRSSRFEIMVLTNYLFFSSLIGFCDNFHVTSFPYLQFTTPFPTFFFVLARSLQANPCTGVLALARVVSQCRHQRYSPPFTYFAHLLQDKLGIDRGMTHNRSNAVDFFLQMFGPFPKLGRTNRRRFLSVFGLSPRIVLASFSPTDFFDLDAKS